MERTAVERIKSMMQRHSLSQSDVGRLLGVGQANINNWLTSTRSPVQAVGRTIELLELMEAFSPALFNSELGKAVK